VDDQYTPAELRVMRAALAAGQDPACPRCNEPMRRKRLGGGSFGLGYARSRDWLICPSCRRSAIFDIKRGTRT
jgi:hypothetical protein